jgi:co-chaperonin GroES (HSP10)
MVAIGRNLIIKPHKEKVEQTKGGLLLTEKNKQNIRYKDADIVSVGEQAASIFKEGDKIKYDKHAGHGIEINDETYHVIKVEDVVVKL